MFLVGIALVLVTAIKVEEEKEASRYRQSKNSR